MTQAFVYRITNSIDDMVYIGSTKRSLSARMIQHRYYTTNEKTKPCFKLQKHMVALGFKNFTITAIHVVEYESRDKLRKLEQEELDKIPKEKRLNVVDAYLCDGSCSVAEKAYIYDHTKRDREKKRENNRKSYHKMMQDPEKAAKERERNKIRMRIKRSTKKESVQRLNGYGHEELNQTPVIA